MSDFQDFVAPGDESVMIALMNGHTAVVYPKPTTLHKRFWKEATRQGCYPASMAEQIVEADENRSEDATRTDLIKMAMRKMADDEDNFTANGLPNAKILAKTAGFDVMREERDKVWEMIRREFE